MKLKWPVSYITGKGSKAKYRAKLLVYDSMILNTKVLSTQTSCSKFMTLQQWQDMSHIDTNKNIWYPLWNLHASQCLIIHQLTYQLFNWAITWTNADLLSVETWGAMLYEIWILIQRDYLLKKERHLSIRYLSFPPLSQAATVAEWQVASRDYSITTAIVRHSSKVTSVSTDIILATYCTAVSRTVLMIWYNSRCVFWKN